MVNELESETIYQSHGSHRFRIETVQVSHRIELRSTASCHLKVTDYYRENGDLFNPRRSP